MKLVGKTDMISYGPTVFYAWVLANILSLSSSGEDILRRQFRTCFCYGSRFSLHFDTCWIHHYSLPKDMDQFKFFGTILNPTG